MSLLSNADQSKVKLTPLTNFALLLGIVSAGAYLRFTNIPETISGASSTPLSSFFAGIRLYLLPWWNFTDWLRQNFFKSLVYPHHGWGDTIFYYPVVKIYSWLSIPLTEWNLFAASALLGTLTVVLVYHLVASLFDAPVGLISATILALSPTHIFFTTQGNHLAVTIFLQVSSVLVYLLYLRRRTWWTLFLAAVLLGIQAGCANFYYIAILLLLHFCYVYEEQRSLKENVTSFRHSIFSWQSILVWSPYIFMWIVNIHVYLRIGHQQDLTLLGHVLNFSSTPPHGVPISWVVTQTFKVIDLAFMIKSTFFPIYTVAFISALVLSLRHARRFTMRGFVWWWSLLVAALIIYSIKRQGVQNAIHLLIPSSILIAATISNGLKITLQRLRSQDHSWGAHTYGPLVLVLMLVLTPGVFAPKLPRFVGPLRFDSDAYRGMKAAGSVLRTLGSPKMNVFVLTTNAVAPFPFEYYSGLSQSNSHYEPNQLFYHNPVYAPRGGILQPETLIAAYCLKDFDFYAEFVGEPPYPQKASELARLKARGVNLVAAIYRSIENSEPEVRIYSPYAIPFRRYVIRDQEDLFDRKFANTDNLFYNVNVGTAFWYGWHWYTEPMEACEGIDAQRRETGFRSRGLF